MAVVGLVLLIACANLGSLMFARAIARNKEFAVRQALGASRTRLIRQLLTECVVLSSGGALLGALLARWTTTLLARSISTAQNSVFLDLSLDTRMLGFVLAGAGLTPLLFGLLPHGGPRALSFLPEPRKCGHPPKTCRISGSSSRRPH